MEPDETLIEREENGFMASSDAMDYPPEYRTGK